MAFRRIVTGERNEKLRKQCKKVAAIDHKLLKLLDDMCDTMRKSDGIGIAAPQVGVLKRVVVIDVGEGVLELINPEMIYMDGTQCEEEGCLSVPYRRGIVERPMVAKVVAYDRNGNLMEYTGEGTLARAFSHELDHLDGILFTDKMIREVIEEVTK
jgi:peptide deformylase